MEVDLKLGGGLYMRVLDGSDAALLAEATGNEPGRSLWGPYPVGPYTLRDAQTALSEWDPAGQGQFCIGILRETRLLGAVGLMPDSPTSLELAYWVRPEERGRGLATRAVQAATLWAHDTLGTARIWLEIDPGNEPSLRLARRVDFRFEQRVAEHCRTWSSPDPALDSWHDCLIWTHTRAWRSPGAALG
jgi:RimJ/RimL family protein N-acetyltransferase